MPMTLVKGHYRIVGASPDGDSVRFYPLDPAVWAAAGIVVRTNSTGGVQLRLDAIDALETHYTPPHARSPWRQPADLGDGAAAALLKLLGFRNVVRDERGYVTSAAPVQTPGYILTRFADKYGRAVATAFPGGRRGRGVDGSGIYLDVDELHRSVNYQLLRAGWVYPTFYSKLYVDLREGPGRRRGGRPDREQGCVGAGRDPGRVPAGVPEPAVRGPGDLPETVPPARGVPEPGRDRQGQPGRFSGVPRRPRRPVVHRPRRPGHHPRHPDHPPRADPDPHHPAGTDRLRRRLTHNHTWPAARGHQARCPRIGSGLRLVILHLIPPATPGMGIGRERERFAGSDSGGRNPGT